MCDCCGPCSWLLSTPFQEFVKVLLQNDLQPILATLGNRQLQQRDQIKIKITFTGAETIQHWSEYIEV